LEEKRMLAEVAELSVTGVIAIAALFIDHLIHLMASDWSTLSTHK
jgi:hypothetical protein